MREHVSRYLNDYEPFHLFGATHWISIVLFFLVALFLQLIAKKGDVIFLDAMLYHRAGENLTSKDRNLIVNMFTLPFVKPQLNLPFLGKNM